MSPILCIQIISVTVLLMQGGSQTQLGESINNPHENVRKSRNDGWIPSGKGIQTYSNYSFNATRTVSTRTPPPLIKFNKCCNVDEELDSNFQCIMRDNSIGSDYWIPVKTLAFDSGGHYHLKPTDFTRIEPQYNVKIYCNEQERKVIQWMREQPSKEDTYFIWTQDSTAPQDGALVVHNLSKYDKSDVLEAYFPASSFCLDTVADTYRYHAAILCLCNSNKQVCVRKCCSRHSYFNVTHNECTKFKGPLSEFNDYNPTIYDNETVIQSHDQIYWFKKMPTCGNTKKVLLNSYINKSRIRIQINGSLLLKHDDGSTQLLPNSKYCVDRFIKGNFEEYEDVVYCSNIKRAVPKMPQRKVYWHRQKNFQVRSNIDFCMFFLILFIALILA